MLRFLDLLLHSVSHTQLSRKGDILLPWIPPSLGLLLVCLIVFHPYSFPGVKYGLIYFCRDCRFAVRVPGSGDCFSMCRMEFQQLSLCVDGSTTPCSVLESCVLLWSILLRNGVFRIFLMWHCALDLYNFFLFFVLKKMLLFINLRYENDYFSQQSIPKRLIVLSNNLFPSGKTH